MYIPLFPLLFSILAFVTYISVVRVGTRGQSLRRTWPLYAYALAGAAVVTFVAFTIL
jgi:hypothetical protein